MEKMNKEMMEIMVHDFLANHQEEMEDLIIDSDAYYSDELGLWCVDAHDSKTDYVLVEDGSGNIEIH